jgi:hypothetical protein
MVVETLPGRHVKGVSALVLVAFALLASDCSTSKPPLGPSCLIGEWTRTWQVPAYRLDLVFVLATSPGMQPHLDRLRAQLPSLLEVLTAPQR